MEILQLSIAVALVIFAIFGLSGCGSNGTDCDEVGDDRSFDGQWIQVGSSNGQQGLDVNFGWTTGGRPSSKYWGLVENSLKVGFAFGPQAYIIASVAEGIVETAQDLFDPSEDAREGTATYHVSFPDQVGTIWQWQWNNGEACAGTKLKTTNFMLTPMGHSNHPPCCAPSQFASQDVHGECQPNTPVFDASSCPSSQPVSRIAMQECTNSGIHSFTMADDGRITLRRDTSFCITQSTDTTVLSLLPCDPDKDDKQKFVHNDDNTLRLQSDNSKCIDSDSAYSDNPVIMWDCFSPLVARQQWVYGSGDGTLIAVDNNSTCMTLSDPTADLTTMSEPVLMV